MYSCNSAKNIMVYHLPIIGAAIRGIAAISVYTSIRPVRVAQQINVLCNCRLQANSGLFNWTVSFYAAVIVTPPLLALLACIHANH